MDIIIFENIDKVYYLYIYIVKLQFPIFFHVILYTLTKI